MRTPHKIKTWFVNVLKKWLIEKKTLGEEDKREINNWFTWNFFCARGVSNMEDELD